MIAAAAGTFSPSVVLPPDSFLDSVVGWNEPAAAEIDPFVSQPANESGVDRFSSVYIPKGSNVVDIEDVDEGARALREGDAAFASRDFPTVGERYRAARKFMDRHLVGDLETAASSPYVRAALGEAYWSKDADSTTYEALDRVARIAEKSGNRKLALEHMLARGNLIRRLGGESETAWNLLAQIEIEADRADPEQRFLALQSILSRADLAVHEGILSRGKDRGFSFTRTSEMLSSIRELAGAQAERYRDASIAAAGEAHFFAAYALLGSGYPELALDVANRLAEFDPNGAALEALVAPGSPFYAKDGTIHLKGASSTSVGKFVVGLQEGLFQARFSSNLDYWKTAVAGSLLGVGVAAATSGDHYPAMIGMSGFAATAVVGFGKAVKAWRAEETKQARRTGYTTRTAWQSSADLARRLAELSFTYAFFGGALPGVGRLDANAVGDWFVATSRSDGWGQFHGLGSAFSGLGYYFMEHGGHALSQVSAHGPVEGGGRFWDESGKSGTFFPILHNAQHLWLEGGILHIPSATDPAHPVVQFIEEGARNPAVRFMEAVSGSWAMATMVKPNLRDNFHRWKPNAMRAMELLMLPGAYILGGHAGEAIGVKPNDAWLISAFGMASQPIYHWMSGGKIKNLDRSNVMRNAFVPLLYAGTGGQMVGGVPTETLSDLFAASMAVQIGFIPIGFAHFLLLKFPLLRSWENKGLRSFSAEMGGNFARMALPGGFAGWMGTFTAEGLQQFVQCPWMTRVAQEPVGGSSQLSAFLTFMRPEKKGEEGAGEFFGQARVAGRRWPFLQPLTGEALIERMPPAIAFLFTTVFNKTEPFTTKPEERYYMMAHKALMDKKLMSAEEVETYLSHLDYIARDLDHKLRDVRHNLLVATYAARKGPHGAAIEKFFKERDWIFDQYGAEGKLTRDIETPPTGGFTNFRLARWLRSHLIGHEVNLERRTESRTILASIPLKAR